MKHAASTARTIKARFEILVRELSGKKMSVDDIALNKEVRGLFHQWKSPEKIIEGMLKHEIRRALQDIDPQTGERNRVSVPVLFPTAAATPARSAFITGERRYEFAEEVKSEKKIWLLALEELVKFILGRINKSKLLTDKERQTMVGGIQEAQRLFRRRLA